jgi:DNA invertase Pin-like site-specific DNA recombinase
MRKIGYARVSSVQQSLDRQIASLRAAGCETIFREKMTGRSTKNRPQLEKAIDALATGDILVVAEWDRATRSMLRCAKTNLTFWPNGSRRSSRACPMGSRNGRPSEGSED